MYTHLFTKFYFLFCYTHFNCYLQSYNAKVYQVSSVQLLSHVWLFVTLRTAALQASLSTTNSRSLLKLVSIKPMMTSNHLILCHSLLLLPLIFPSIGVFSNESVLCIRWPKYWSFGASASGYKLPKFINILQYSNINSYPYTLYV